MRQKWNNRSDRSYMMKIYAIYVSCVEPFRLTLPQASPLLMSCNLKSCQQLLILSYWSTRNRGIHTAQWLSMLSILNIFFLSLHIVCVCANGLFFSEWGSWQWNSILLHSELMENSHFLSLLLLNFSFIHSFDVMYFSVRIHHVYFKELSLYLKHNIQGLY